MNVSLIFVPILTYLRASGHEIKSGIKELCNREQYGFSYLGPVFQEYTNTQLLYRLFKLNSSIFVYSDRQAHLQGACYAPSYLNIKVRPQIFHHNLIKRHI